MKFTEAGQRFILCVGLSLLLIISACSSGGNTQSTTAQIGTVSGQVVSAANSAVVAGATVSTTAGSTTSAADGSFTVAAGAGDRTVVHVEATGFAEAFPVARVTAGQTTTLGVKLLAVGVTTPMTVTTGGTVTVPNSNAQVDLPANGLVPKNGGTVAGTVNVAVTPINPAVDPTLMPGDYNGVSAGGVTTPIESFGALAIDIRDSAGTRYNLAAGKTSTIRIPLGTLSPNPPATIPLWFFDETTGLWKEEGTATLKGTAPNQFYEGTVEHFSRWNADNPLLRTFVSGCVRDANGQPVANVRVQSTGIDYTGTAYDITAADGTFKVGVRKGSSATISVVEWSLAPLFFGAVSNTVTVAPSDVDRTLSDCLVKQPAPLTVMTTALPAGNVGAAYSQTLAASGGMPGYIWGLNAGSNPLPAGLQLNPSGVISGTPPTAGTTIITVKVTDSSAGTATKELSITISPSGVAPLSITTSSPLPVGIVGTAYNTTFLASGGTGTLSWSVVSGALPAGLQLNASTGQISGTPTTAGTSTFTIQVQDSGSPQQTDQKQFSLTINPITGGGGSWGVLTVSNAPASVGGTFVPDPQLPSVSHQSNNIAGVGWGETVTSTVHSESLAVVFDYVTGQISSVGLASLDPPLVSFWGCHSNLSGCAGATINRVAGTFTLTNVVLPAESGNPNPAITLNGTLTFTPF